MLKIKFLYYMDYWVLLIALHLLCEEVKAMPIIEAGPIRRRKLEQA